MDHVTIAKKATHMIVALYAAQAVKDQVVEHTDIDPENIPLQVGSFVAGHLVANQTDKLTGPAIEKAAAWIRNRRSKKNNPESE